MAGSPVAVQPTVSRYQATLPAAAPGGRAVLGRWPTLPARGGFVYLARTERGASSAHVSNRARRSSAHHLSGLL